MRGLRPFIVVLTALTALAACTATPRPNYPVAVARLDSLWYVSVRARDHGRDTHRFADSLEFGLVISHVQAHGNPLVDRLDITPIDSVRFSASAFGAALRARAAGADDSMAVLMVHGYSTSLHKAWRESSEAHIRSRTRAPWVVFCWPSNGAGFVWARRGDFFTQSYRDDSTTAAASVPAFGDAVRLLLRSVGGAHLMLIAHSMGAQLVARAFTEDATLRTTLQSAPLRVLAYFSPDLSTRYFDDVVAPAMTSIAQRTLLYAASDDRMLALSRGVNQSERAGLISTDSEPAVVETIDATEGVAAEDRFQRFIGTHHTIRRSSGALFDLLQVVGPGYSNQCRLTLHTASQLGVQRWKLTPLPPPPLSALAKCH
jgi:esterase/lipase superfamily enzyme